MACLEIWNAFSVNWMWNIDCFCCCPFAENVWRSLWCRFHVPWAHKNWEDLIHWVTFHFEGKSLLSIIVCTIWRERKVRLFQRLIGIRDTFSITSEMFYWVRTKVNSIQGIHLWIEIWQDFGIFLAFVFSSLLLVLAFPIWLLCCLFLLFMGGFLVFLCF
jgi:hypothetical protein